MPIELSDLKKAIKGVVVVQTTPFNKDGSLDLEGMRANTRWLLKQVSGKDFILNPLGTTGEFYAMSDDELEARIEVLIQDVRNSTLLEGVERVYIPGEIEYEKREQRIKEGIPLPTATLTALERFAEETGIETKLR